MTSDKMRIILDALLEAAESFDSRVIREEVMEGRFLWSDSTSSTYKKMAEECRALYRELEAETDEVIQTPPFEFTYRNRRGEVARRRAVPISTRFGSTEWHPEPQWLLRAYDVEKQSEREFAMADIWVKRSWSR